ncbi:MAG: phosphopantothenate--cysteine ligase [Oscillospiraceae bacterium]|nr:phosphopantothenate--cysteine ligase [Oscillospiraceae bacterium]
MNVLVTSGGTSEKIDSVRGISNISTGRLGSLIAGRFAEEADVDKIYYICSGTAVRPDCGKTQIIPADSVADLESAVRNLLGKTKIDIIIHSMAVSDYRVRAVSSADALALALAQCYDNTGEADIREKLAELIKSHGTDEKSAGKLPSDKDDMLLFMERTPKIIPIFGELSPQSTLVGFKLLDGVPLQALIDRGRQILTQNKCAFVLANDLRDISDTGHIGYLIGKDGGYTRHTSKSEIADAIVCAAVGERRRLI